MSNITIYVSNLEINPPKVLDKTGSDDFYIYHERGALEWFRTTVMSNFPYILFSNPFVCRYSHSPLLRPLDLGAS